MLNLLHSHFCMLILIFFLKLVQKTCFVYSYSNCSKSSLVDVVRPRIIIHSGGSLTHFPNPEIVELNTEVGFDRRQIECLHHLPIHWVVNIHSVNSQFEMRRNFFQKRNTSGTGIEYSVYMVLMYKPKLLQDPHLFSCQPIKLENTECERNFLEITPGRKSPIFKTSLNPSSKIFKDLSDTLLLLPIKPGNKSVHECEMVLYIKESPGNRLEYKWKLGPSTTTTTNSTSGKVKVQSVQLEKVFTTDQGTYFRNLFPLVKREMNCVKVLDWNEICDECSSGELPQGILNSVVFYAKSGIHEIVFKGVFNISTSPQGARKFYLEEDVPLKEMIHLEVPSVFYVNQTIQINCSVSLIYFAHGTIISTEDESPRESPADEYARYREVGRREVSRNITLRNGGNAFTIINCSAILWNYTKRISKSERVYVLYPELPTFNNSEVAGKTVELIVQPDELNRTISCEVYGKPVPYLRWTFPNPDVVSKLLITSEMNSEMTRSTIQFPMFIEQFLGTYNCVAWNYLATVSTAYNLQFPINGLSGGVKGGIGSAVGILILLFITIILIIYRKIIIQRQEYRTRTAEAIEEFKKGANRNNKSGQQEQTKQKNELNPSILELPYNDNFEVPLIKWTIDDKFLGAGAFGIVRKGSVEQNGRSQVIAIKTLQSTSEIEDFRGFLTELKIMAYIGHHTNVVSLVAACTQNIDQRDVMIGVEFCPNGNLTEYLQSKRKLFQASSTVSKSDEVNRQIAKISYANLPSVVGVTEMDLLTWGYQIANGMEFLATKKVLHGDLATRNVLLGADKTAKISDFGLSRVLLDSSNYTKKSRVPLPWKWMSIESLKSMNFSTASDVWAYGVTIWEIWSLGEVPYAGLHFSPDFIVELEAGLRLRKPAVATEYIYNIMNHCWMSDVTQRVTFSQLKSAFAEILGSLDSCEVPSKNDNNSPSPSDNVPQKQTSIVHHKVQNPSTSWYSNAPNGIKTANLYVNS